MAAFRAYFLSHAAFVVRATPLPHPADPRTSGTRIPAFPDAADSDARSERTDDTEGENVSTTENVVEISTLIGIVTEPVPETVNENVTETENRNRSRYRNRHQNRNLKTVAEGKTVDSAECAIATVTGSSTELVPENAFQAVTETASKSYPKPQRKART